MAVITGASGHWAIVTIELPKPVKPKNKKKNRKFLIIKYFKYSFLPRKVTLIFKYFPRSPLKLNYAII